MQNRAVIQGVQAKMTHPSKFSEKRPLLLEELDYLDPSAQIIKWYTDKALFSQMSSFDLHYGLKTVSNNKELFEKKAKLKKADYMTCNNF